MARKGKAIGTALLAELEKIEDLTPEKSKELAAKYGCSERTVRNSYKKVLSLRETSELSTKDKQFLAQSIKIPKRLQDKIDAYTYWKAYQDDPEEGWHALATQGALQSGKSVFFAGIVYATDKDEFEEMLEPLTTTGIPYEYIWHDCDFWLHDSPEAKDPETGVLIFKLGERYHKGDLKKPHGHIIIKWGSMKSWSENQTFVNQIFGIHTLAWIIVGNPHGMHDYLCHATPKARAEHKYQYSRQERIQVNGFEITLTRHEKDMILQGILNYIYEEQYKEYGRYEYSDLVNHFRGQADISGQIRGASQHLKSICDGLRYLEGLSQTASERGYYISGKRDYKKLKEEIKKQREGYEDPFAECEEEQEEGDIDYGNDGKERKGN